MGTCDLSQTPDIHQCIPELLKTNKNVMQKSRRILIANLLFISGGTLVLSTLCATLRKLGYDARLIIRDYDHYGKKPSLIISLIRIIQINIFLILLRVPFIPKKWLTHFNTTVTRSNITEYIKYKIIPPINKDDYIVIYPEIIWGNPFKIKNVVRWLLYHHKYYEAENTFDKDDYFISFREIFNDSKLNPENNILKIKNFDKLLYRQYNWGERKGNCYIIRKGANRKDLPSKFDGPVFNGDMSDEEFVKILNDCKYCYSYDTQTFYCSIAAICGCIPIVMLEPGKEISDYLTPDEKHYGVAYGNTPDQIEYAISTREKLIESLDFEKSNQINALNFIKSLEKRFGPIKRI